MARSHDQTDVHLTSLATVIHDREICCGKDSALEDSAEAAAPKSLQQIAAKMAGADPGEGTVCGSRCREFSQVVWWRSLFGMQTRRAKPPCIFTNICYGLLAFLTHAARWCTTPRCGRPRKRSRTLIRANKPAAIADTITSCNSYSYNFSQLFGVPC